MALPAQWSTHFYDAIRIVPCARKTPVDIRAGWYIISSLTMLTRPSLYGVTLHFASGVALSQDIGVRISQVKPSNCFRRLEKLVSPSFFDTGLSSLKMANLQCYPATVLNGRVWHYMKSKHTLSLPTHFQTSRPHTQDPYLRAYTKLWLRVTSVDTHQCLPMTFDLGRAEAGFYPGTFWGGNFPPNLATSPPQEFFNQLWFPRQLFVLTF